MFFEVKPGLQTGGTHSVSLKVKSSGAPLRVVLAYSDYPGPALVNNLNLFVRSPSGKLYLGNQPAGQGLAADTKNNVEVVRVAKPKAGVWSVRVVGSNVPHGPQEFAMVGVGPL